MIDRFEMDWFQRNHEYSPSLQRAGGNSSDMLEILATGKLVMREGRKYVQVNCQRSLTFLERTARLVAALAVTILTGFIALILQNVRDLWLESFRGKVYAQILFGKPSSSCLEGRFSTLIFPQNRFEAMIPDFDVTRNGFADLSNEEKRQQIEILYQSLDLKILSIQGHQRGDLIEAWLNDPRNLGKSMSVATGLQNMWLNALKGDSQQVRHYVQGMFGQLESDQLFYFLRERSAIARYYRNLYAQNSPSVPLEIAAQWEKLGSAITEYIHKVADLTEVTEEYCRMYRVRFPF